MPQAPGLPGPARRTTTSTCTMPRRQAGWRRSRARKCRSASLVTPGDGSATELQSTEFTMQENLPLSRPEFVAATTAGAIGLLRATEAFASPAARLEEPLLYVGTYTDAARREGIYLLRMDSRTGGLQRIAAMDAGPNPSFLAIHPTGRTLYAVNEVTEMSGKVTGSVRSLGIDADSSGLPLLNQQMSEGAAPCYVTTDRTS